MVYILVESTARSAGILIDPAEGFSRAEHLLPFRQKFKAVLDQFFYVLE